MKTYLHIVVLLSLMVVGCARTVDDRVEEVVATPSLLKLSAIDSLMWWRADSALAVMLEFAESEAADSLDVFEGHYCQVLIAELLYKNYYKQSNRNFQIITFLPNKKSRDKTRRPPQNLLTSNLYH